MSGAIAKAAKPQLRGLLHSQIKKNLVVALALCVAGGVGQHLFINEPAKKRYAEFYKTYDIEKEFNEIRNKGLFDSAKAD